VMRARISVRSVKVQQRSHTTELEEANAQLRTELATTHTKVAEVERRERSLTFDYDGLRRDFNDLQTSHATVVKEKAYLEKMEHEPIMQEAGRASSRYGRVNSRSWGAVHGFSHYQCHCLRHAGVVSNGGPIVAYHLCQAQREYNMFCSDWCF
jgi:hypothetical protein